MILRIRIPRRNLKCNICAVKFSVAEEYVSMLNESCKEGEYNRFDYCARCWENEKEKQLRMYWRGRIQKRKQFSEDPEEHLMEAVSLLKEEVGKMDLDSQQTAFILALYLQRKKRAFFCQLLQTEEGEFHLYELAETAEMIPVKKVQVPRERLANIQEALKEQLFL